MCCEGLECNLGWGKKIQQQNDSDPLRLPQIFVAGVIAGIATTVITAPMELVKLRLQIQGSEGNHVKPKYSGVLDCGMKIYEKQGVRGLYRGTMATLIRDIPGYVLLLSYVSQIIFSYLN